MFYVKGNDTFQRKRISIVSKHSLNEMQSRSTIVLLQLISFQLSKRWRLGRLRVVMK